MNYNIYLYFIYIIFYLYLYFILSLFIYLGSCLLIVGWFGFNAGSAFGANEVAGFAMINTLISRFYSIFLNYYYHFYY